MIKHLFLLLIGLFITIQLYSQSPSDALMMKAGQACVLLDYSFSSFDHYWEGTKKRTNATVATVQRNAVMPMVAAGIFNNLSVFAGVSYISTGSTEPNGGHLVGANGFQDLSIAVKYRWLNKQFSKGEIAGLATVGFSTPISNYLSDYMPYSLGLGAPELSYRAILQYKFAYHWYVRGAAAYLWRGYTEVEREYYYSNGSYYTSWMDVPSAITAEMVAGKWFFANTLLVEMSYFNSKSLSGDDIRAYLAPIPTNRVHMETFRLFGHYFIPKAKGLGVIAYHRQVVNGRNTAAMATTGVGLTYFFNYKSIAQ